jgi:hypothetical protein
MDVPDEPTTPFGVVSAHTSKLQRVGCDREQSSVRASCGLTKFWQQYQALLDRSTPYVLYRWIGTGVGLMIFFLRVFMAQGWYIG